VTGHNPKRHRNRLRTGEDHQNSKSTENRNRLEMLALLGVANREMGELSGPKSWFRETTLVWLRILNDSTTKSSFPRSPTLKNFSTRKSNCTWVGVSNELRPKLSGREANGIAPLRLASKPVRAFDRPATPDYQDRSGFNIAEHLGHWSGSLFAFFLVSERKIESAAEHESMPLIVGR